MVVKKKSKVKVKAKAKTKVKKKATAKKVNVTVNVTVNPPAKPSVRKNYVMMVLDESSSMMSIRDQAISAFNEQIKTVRDSKGTLDVSVSLVKFASEVTTVFENRPVDSVENLSQFSYLPNGMTAMYDGVGKALELLKARPDINDPDVTVLVLIISDGEENSSRRWSSARLADEIRTLQGTKRWTFTYAGANQDLSKISETLNIPLGNTSAFVASAAGMSANNSLRSASTKGLYASYSTGQLSVQNFYNQADDQSGAAVKTTTGITKTDDPTKNSTTP